MRSPGETPAAPPFGSGWTGQLEVLDVLPGAVMVAIGRIVYANPAALMLFGVATLAELIERERSRAHLLRDDLELLAQRRSAPRRGEITTGSAELRVLRPDGTVRVVEWSTRPFTLGGHAALLHAVEDITMLVETRDAVRDSEGHQREVVATLAEGVIVVDPAGVCTDANPSAVELLGLGSLQELIGVPGEMMPLVDARGEPLERWTHPLWRALDHREQVRSETYSVAFPRHVRVMRVSVIPMAGTGEHAGGAVVTFDDVTEQLRAQEQLAKNEERFRKLTGIAPVAVFETDAAGICTYVNDRAREFSGEGADGGVGRLWTELVHPEDRARLTREWDRSVAAGVRFKSEYRYLHVDGTETFVYCEAAPIRDDSGEIVGWIGSAMDVTAELALREGLRDSETRFRLLVERSSDVVVRIALHPWRVEYMSPSIMQLTGRRPEEFYADTGLLARCIHPDDAAIVADSFASAAMTKHVECRVVHGDGSIRTVEVRRTVVTVDGVPLAVEATVRDATRRATELRVLDALAHRDELTGLPNRRALLAALDGRLAARQPTSVIFLDLDGFKHVNDLHGHDVGDELLKLFAARLVGIFREDDFVGRLGGDEFVVIARPQDSDTLARRVVDEFAAPLVLPNGHRVAIGVSAGITNFDSTGPLQQSDGLLQQADQAMYEAKRRGKGQVVTTP